MSAERPSTGKARRTITTSSLAPVVDAARENVAKWIYRPAILNGEAVKVNTELDVHFSLNQ